MATLNKIHTCFICLEEYPTARGLYIHLQMNHYGPHSNNDFLILNTEENKSKRTYKCVICTETFNGLRALYTHQRIHFNPTDSEIQRRKRRRLQFKNNSVPLIRNQIGLGSRKVPRNPKMSQEVPEPQPDQNGVQLRINKTGNLRRPTEEEQEMDVNEQEAEVSDSMYELRERSRRHNKKFNAEDIIYGLIVDDSLIARTIASVLNELYNIFQSLLQNLKNDLQNGDLVRFYMNHPILHAPIIIPAQPIENISIEDIMTEIEKVLQSEEELPLDENFEIHVGTLRIPRGGRGQQMINTQAAIKKKRSIVEIVNNDDSLCFDRAVVVCLAKLDNNKQKWKKIIRKDKNYQRKEAEKMRKSVGLPLDHQVSIQDIETYENLLDVQIIIVGTETENSIIYPGKERRDNQIYILKHQEHYHSILSISGFYGKNHFCNTCLVAYNNHNHNCSTTCNVCKSNHCVVGEAVACGDCNMTCRSEECFRRHKASTYTKGSEEKNKKSLCVKFWLCLNCHIVMNREKRPETAHVCGEYLCQNCKEYVIGSHLCYQRYNAPKDKISRFVYFDFESRQDVKAECSQGYRKPLPCVQEVDHNCKKCTLCMNCKQTWCGMYKHLPNFAVAQTVCENCIEKPLTKESKCNTCGSRCEQCRLLDRKGKYVNEPCPNTCGFQERIFKGDSTGDSFSQWLFHSKRSNFVAIAHNMGGYDGYFLLEYLLKNGKKPDKIIYQGSYITFMEIDQGINIRVIDSLKFLPMKLSKLSKAFGIMETKGWFPHFFNLRENWDYVGPYPASHFYGEKMMNEEESSEFLNWHKEKTSTDQVFNFQHEIENYCRLDVDILRQSCLKYKKLMWDATTTKYGDNIKAGVDPWTEFTVASVCSQVYRSKFLEEKWSVKLADDIEAGEVDRWKEGKLKDGVLWVKVHDDDNNSWTEEGELDIEQKHFVSSPIAQIPSGGYTTNINFSKISISWLEWLMETERRKGNENYHIEHALNGTEKKIEHTNINGRRCFYRADGFNQNTNTVFEFLGCRVHGHHCLSHARDKPIYPNSKQTPNQLYHATLLRQRNIEELGYNYKCIWECQFRQQIKENQDLKTYVNTLSVEDRLNPRDAFMGGRTNAAKLYYKVDNNEKMYYIDYTSLYGWVNKYAKYPTGHPTIITQFEPQSKIGDYFGIAKVTVMPPRKLLHPVLPVKMGDKLMFPLCKTCAERKATAVCKHKGKQREIVGTWCTPELIEAEKQGYEIIKIHEVYHWNSTTQYNPATGDGGLFAGYINTFLKYKQEASDWPVWCNDQESKDRYLQSYFDKEGIQLNPDNMSHNPGLRSLAKLKLTNMWGKWGQRDNQLQTKFVDNLTALCDILTDDSICVHDLQVINDKVLLLQYKQQNEFSVGGTRSNIFIAAFTTCYARLKLYSELVKLGDRVCYYDTDSYIIICRPGEYEPELGDYLGELTDELSCKAIGCRRKNCQVRHYIVEFVSAGPKNYAYKTDIGTTVCKVRGFTLNKTNKMIINFESMKEIVCCPENTEKTCSISKAESITRLKSRSIIYNRPQKKIYRKVYDKRILKDDYTTIPYGY